MTGEKLTSGLMHSGRQMQTVPGRNSLSNHFSIWRGRGVNNNARDFLRSESGVTAVEFSLIALPLFTLLFAIMEIGLFYFYSSQLQMAAEIASRDLMTGALAPGTTVQKFIDDELCQTGGLLKGLLDCSQLRIDVGSPNAWNSADVSNNYLAFSVDKAATINPPAPGRIGILRIAYPLPVFLGFIGVAQTGAVPYNGKLVRMIMGIAAFRAEK